MAKKKAAPKKKATTTKKANPKKKAATKKIAKRPKPAAKKKNAPPKKSSLKTGRVQSPQAVTRPVVTGGRRGLGSESGGQAGDTQSLSRREEAESESVEELSEEGQDFEAEVVRGVENALDPDEGEVTTSEVPEDDVPEEYLDGDK